MNAFAGTVKDENGEPLEGATVVFRGLDIALEREIKTDEKGKFYYGGFLPGRYQITVKRGEEVLWSHSLRLPYFREVLRLEVNLQKLQEAARKLRELDQELQQRREIEQQRRERREKLDGHFNRGMRYMESGQNEKAIAELRAARAMQPERGVTHALLATALADAGRTDEAISGYRRAIQLEPEEAAHYNNLGRLLIEKGRIEEGLAHLDHALRLDPDRAATYLYNRGAALLNAGRTEAALAAFRQAVDRNPVLAVAHYFLGLARLRTSPGFSPEQPERAEVKPGTLEAFKNYLLLEPEGDYAPQARAYLEKFGVAPPAPLPSGATAETRP